MAKRELVDLRMQLVGETEKAYRLTDGKAAVWLPKSQIEWDPDSGTVTLPIWLAQEKELI